MITLKDYGWDTTRANEWAQSQDSSLVPARIIADYGQQYKIALPDEQIAKLSGALTHKLKTFDMPKIGDWVAAELKVDGPAIIQAVLPRTSEIVRGHVGRLLYKQVVAANVDTAFIMQSLDHDFSPARLERYVFQLTSQAITPIIVLNKLDIAHHVNEMQAQVKSLDTQVITISALTDRYIDAIKSHILPGDTAVILGSSGVGKSTLTNRLLGTERQATQSVRERDSKGRHTTVHRELFLLPNGGMIIDTPGIRELQLWGDVHDLNRAFPEIAAAIALCHYPNCTHNTEDRCGVKQGLADGSISVKRLRIYNEFQRELLSLEARRGFIQDRRGELTRESLKRRHRRGQRHIQDKEPTTDYESLDN